MNQKPRTADEVLQLIAALPEDERVKVWQCFPNCVSWVKTYIMSIAEKWDSEEASLRAHQKRKILDESEQPEVLVDIIRLSESGWSDQRIAYYLNDRDSRNKDGKEWTKHSVIQLRLRAQRKWGNRPWFPKLNDER